MSFENTIIVGHLGRDPEMRYTPNGKPVTNSSEAVSRKYTGKDGQRQAGRALQPVSAQGPPGAGGGGWRVAERARDFGQGTGSRSLVRRWTLALRPA